MNHLTTTEIIDFVSINNPDADSMKLASRVNGHIRKCDECLKLVESFQTSDFEQIMTKNSSEIKSSELQK